MFKSTKTVIFLSKEKVVAGNINTRPPLQVKDKSGGDWTGETLSKVLKEIKENFKVKTVRLLLSDDLSYVVRFKIPVDLKGEAQRQAITEKIQSQIPEILENKDWNYKETGEKDDNQEIIAFAPVKEPFQQISIAFNTAGLEIEAIEPELVAKQRHEDPMIGLAIKKDVGGKDGEALNVPPVELSKPEESENEEEEQVNKKNEAEAESAPPQSEEKKSKLKPLLLLFGGLFILGAVIAGGIYYSSQSQLPSPLTKEEPTPTPSPNPTPEPELVLSEYSVWVLNGSGVAGEAGVVSGLLEEAGFEEITAGNADTYDYKDTGVSFKKEGQERLFEKIKEALTDYNVVEGDPLTEESEYDVLVVVGEKSEE